MSKQRRHRVNETLFSRDTTKKHVMNTILPSAFTQAQHPGSKYHATTYIPTCTTTRSHPSRASRLSKAPSDTNDLAAYSTALLVSPASASCLGLSDTSHVDPDTALQVTKATTYFFYPDITRHTILVSNPFNPFYSVIHSITINNLNSDGQRLNQCGFVYDVSRCFAVRGRWMVCDREAGERESLE